MLEVTAGAGRLRILLALERRCRYQQSDFDHAGHNLRRGSWVGRRHRTGLRDTGADPVFRTLRLHGHSARSATLQHACAEAKDGQVLITQRLAARLDNITRRHRPAGSTRNPECRIKSTRKRAPPRPRHRLRSSAAGHEQGRRKRPSGGFGSVTQRLLGHQGAAAQRRNRFAHEQ